MPEFSLSEHYVVRPASIPNPSSSFHVESLKCTGHSFFKRWPSVFGAKDGSMSFQEEMLPLFCLLV